MPSAPAICQNPCPPPSPSTFLPDLTVTDLRLTQTPNLETPLYGSVTYKNIGNAISPTFTHRFSLNDNVIYEYYFVGLNPGESKTIGLDDRLPNREAWKPAPGTNILTADVDYTNSIAEFCDTNNSRFITFEVNGETPNVSPAPTETPTPAPAPNPSQSSPTDILDWLRALPGIGAALSPVLSFPY